MPALLLRSSQVRGPGHLAVSSECVTSESVVRRQPGPRILLTGCLRAPRPRAPAMSGRSLAGLTVDSAITGESLHDPPGLQCGDSSPAGPVGRPELNGSGTDGTFRVLRFRTIPVARRPAADSAKSRRTLTGRLRVGPAGAAAQGSGFPGYCGWGRLLPRSVPRGSRAVSTPGSVPSWRTGRQFPGSVPHGAQAVSSQNPVAPRPSVPRPAPPAP